MRDCGSATAEAVPSAPDSRCLTRLLHCTTLFTSLLRKKSLCYKVMTFMPFLCKRSVVLECPVIVFQDRLNMSCLMTTSIKKKYIWEHVNIIRLSVKQLLILGIFCFPKSIYFHHNYSMTGTHNYWILQSPEHLIRSTMHTVLKNLKHMTSTYVSS